MRSIDLAVEAARDGDEDVEHEDEIVDDDADGSTVVEQQTKRRKPAFAPLHARAHDHSDGADVAITLSDDDDDDAQRVDESRGVTAFGPAHNAARQRTESEQARVIDVADDGDKRANARHSSDTEMVESPRTASDANDDDDDDDGVIVLQPLTRPVLSSVTGRRLPSSMASSTIKARSFDKAAVCLVLLCVAGWSCNACALGRRCSASGARAGASRVGASRGIGGDRRAHGEHELSCVVRGVQLYVTCVDRAAHSATYPSRRCLRGRWARRRRESNRAVTEEHVRVRACVTSD
jgi:hypothetical protein